LTLSAAVALVGATIAATTSNAAVLDFAAVDLGGGLFRYNLTLNNPFDQPLSGLDLLHAASAFGVADSSVIGAPIGWDFFAPLPSIVDELSYFSLSATTDVPIGGSLAGFTFQSTRDPSTVTVDNLAFDVV